MRWLEGMERESRVGLPHSGTDFCQRICSWDIWDQKLMCSTALLKAIAQKLIPGIPNQTRISILQQTVSEGQSTLEEDKNESKLSVLEEVIDRATSKNEIQHEINSKS